VWRWGNWFQQSRTRDYPAGVPNMSIVIGICHEYLRYAWEKEAGKKSRIYLEWNKETPCAVSENSVE
jgi:hypothetical protein